MYYIKKSANKANTNISNHQCVTHTQVTSHCFTELQNLYNFTYQLLGISFIRRALPFQLMGALPSRLDSV